MYLGDATTSDAIDRQKVHVSKLSVAASPDIRSVDANASHDGQLRELRDRVSSVSNICDLQIVTKGTAEETYHLILREFDSVKAASWADRVTTNESSRMSSFNFGLDAGPDNQGNVRRFRRVIGPAPNISYTVVYCFFHSTHLTVKSGYAVCERHSWCADFPTTYFNGISCISNVWRGPGTALKIKDAVAEAFGEEAAFDTCNRVPGRCLKNRWCSGHSVEEIIDRAGPYLNVALSKIFPANTVEAVAAAKAKAKAAAARAKARAKAKAVALGRDDEQDDFEKRRREFRSNSVALSGDKRFLAMVRISVICKFPVIRSMFWAQKAVAAQNKTTLQSRLEGQTYMGPTPLSIFVTYKVASECPMCL
jgi:hypothetical protein